MSKLRCFNENTPKEVIDYGNMEQWYVDSSQHVGGLAFIETLTEEAHRLVWAVRNTKKHGCQIKLVIDESFDDYLVNTDLEFTAMHGYSVLFEDRYYYGYKTEVKNEMVKSTFEPNISTIIKWDDDDTFYFLPNGKYLLSVNIRDRYKLAKAMAKNPKIEQVYKDETTRCVAFNSKFWKLGEAKRKKVVGFMRQGYSFQDALGMIKFGNEREMASKRLHQRAMRNMSFLPKEFRDEAYKRVLEATTDYDRRSFLDMYEDYIELLEYFNMEKTRENVIPRNVQDAHDSLLTAKREIREAERRKKEEEELKMSKPLMEAISNHYLNLLAKDGDLSIEIPNSQSYLVNISDALHNCVGRCSRYGQDMRNGKLLIAIVMENGKPLECCNINLDRMRIDELRGDRNYPSTRHDECEKLINVFLENIRNSPKWTPSVA